MQSFTKCALKCMVFTHAEQTSGITRALEISGIEVFGQGTFWGYQKEVVRNAIAELKCG
jgi:hypothetical protein